MNGTTESENVHDIEKPPEELEIDGESSSDTSREAPRNVAEVVGELRAIDREIYAAQELGAHRDARLKTLRESMGVPPEGTVSPAAEFQDDRIKGLEERKRKLTLEVQGWIERNGRKNLPNGLVIETEDGGFEVKGGSFKYEGAGAFGEKNRHEDLEERKRWIRKFSEETVRDFEQAFRGDRATRNAVNLGLTVELMKLRVPKLIEKKAEDFLNGKVDEPPFAAVWARWNISSLLERILGRPVQMSNVEIVFDDDTAKLADEQKSNKDPTHTSSQNGGSQPSGGR